MMNEFQFPHHSHWTGFQRYFSSHFFCFVDELYHECVCDVFCSVPKQIGKRSVAIVVVQDLFIFIRGRSITQFCRQRSTHI